MLRVLLLLPALTCLTQSAPTSPTDIILRNIEYQGLVNGRLRASKLLPHHSERAEEYSLPATEEMAIDPEEREGEREVEGERHRLVNMLRYYIWATDPARTRKRHSTEEGEGEEEEKLEELNRVWGGNRNLRLVKRSPDRWSTFRNTEKREPSPGLWSITNNMDVLDDMNKKYNTKTNLSKIG